MASAAKTTQADNFRRVAREIECDEDKGRFEAHLGKIASAKPPKDEKPPKKKRPGK